MTEEQVKKISDDLSYIKNGILIVIGLTSVAVGLLMGPVLTMAHIL